ncbi:MAG: GntR family transcriptional regulator [Clostridia bacterium]|nr:GntR family transcriptional regulator [Clostridia bacterium]
MLSFEDFRPEDTTPGTGMPIYQQILRHVRRGIAAGVVLDGDEMPSRRVLSALLGVNPNTIQKAYRILEEEGLITSHAGAKSLISLDEEKIARVREDLLETEVRAAATMLRNTGLTLERAKELLEHYWKEQHP